MKRHIWIALAAAVFIGSGSALAGGSPGPGEAADGGATGSGTASGPGAAGGGGTAPPAPAGGKDEKPSNEQLKTLASKAGYYLASDRKDYVVSHWPMAFVHADIPPYVKSDGTSPANPAASATPPLQHLADSLNKIYEDVYVQPDGDSLLIIGPQERVRRMKILLAKWIDVPYPQVRLNVLSFQAASKNYNADKVTDAVELANAGTALTREYLRAYMIDFGQYVASSADHIRKNLPQPERIQELFGKFHLLGFKDMYDNSRGNGDATAFESLNSGQQRVKPFIDDLAYLALSDRVEFRPSGDGPSSFQVYMANNKARGLLTSFKGQLQAKVAALKSMKPGPGMSRDQLARGIDFAQRLLVLCSRLEEHLARPLPLFNGLVASTDSGEDLRVLLEFMVEYSLPHSYEQIRPSVLLQSDIDVQQRVVNLAIGRKDDAESDLRSVRAAIGNTHALVTQLREKIATIRQRETPAAIRAQLEKSESKLPVLQLEEARLASEIKALEKEIAAGKESATRAAQQKKGEKELEHQKVVNAIARLKADIETLRADMLPGVNEQVNLLSDRLTKAEGEERSLYAQAGSLERALPELYARSKTEQTTLDALKYQQASDARFGDIGGAGRPVDPEYLTILSTNVDELIRNATDTFSRDIEASVIEPLKEWVVANNRGKKDGLVYTGNVGLSVTSSRGAASGGSATFSSPFTPQQTLTTAQLTGLLGIAQGTSAFSGEGLGSLLKGLVGLSGGADLYKPIYSTVAPGLDLAVRPSVLPGARAARLQINFRATNGVTDADATPAGKRPVPIDFVKSHETTSDVAVYAFDLFPLSTFSVETTALGDPQWRIYGLEGLPILGNMFIGPRRPVTSIGRSMVIVYTTILPRSLDIARRYSAVSN